MDDEQNAILQKVIDGKNVFFTGSAGVGKTFVLKSIIDYFKEKYGAEYSKRVVVAAMTGIAASHIDGTTLHSAMGFGVPNGIGDVGDRMAKKKNEIQDLDVLILDECSMLSGEMLYVFEREIKILRRDRNKDIQFIFCGDFFQLSPISKRNAKPDEFSNFGLAFEASTWRRLFAPEDSMVLKKVYRQEDEEFVDLLNRIRVGDRALAAMKTLVSGSDSQGYILPEGFKPTLIYSRNKDIDIINSDELNELPGDVKAFVGQDTVDLLKVNNVVASDSLRKVLLNDEFFKSTCPAPNVLNLKIGAQVMLLRNLDLDAKLFNGSRGVVVGFVKEESLEIPRVRFMNGKIIDIGPKDFERVVRGIGTCKRKQIPLKLAWAITTHKSQGMTLDLAILSLDSVFAPGQAYVGLSRARSRQGLKIRDWDGRIVPVDARVKEFYNALERGEHPPLSKRFEEFATLRGWTMMDTCVISEES